MLQFSLQKGNKDYKFMPSIVYTDFIADIGPIIIAFQEVGIDAVGYH